MVLAAVAAAAPVVVVTAAASVVSATARCCSVLLTLSMASKNIGRRGLSCCDAARLPEQVSEDRWCVKMKGVLTTNGFDNAREGRAVKGWS